MRVARAFNALLYRRAKFEVANELVRLQEGALQEVSRMV